MSALLTPEDLGMRPCECPYGGSDWPNVAAHWPECPAAEDE